MLTFCKSELNCIDRCIKFNLIQQILKTCYYVLLKFVITKVNYLLQIQQLIKFKNFYRSIMSFLDKLDLKDPLIKEYFLTADRFFMTCRRYKKIFNLHQHIMIHNVDLIYTSNKTNHYLRFCW